MTTGRRIFVVAASATILVLAATTGAQAHANLSSSEPASGAQIAAAPPAVELTFTEPIDFGAGTAVEILNAAGSSVGGKISRVAGDANSMRAAFKGTERGVYTVSWRVLSRVDGHVTAGAFAFGVGVSPEGAVIPEPETVSGPTGYASAGRALVLAGIVLMVGAGWMSRFAFVAPPSRLRAAAWIGMLIASIGIIVLADAQRRAAALSLSAFRDTGLFVSATHRFIPIAVAIALALVRRRWTWFAALGGGVSLAYVHASHGHAGAASTPLVSIAQQGTHIVAAGVWMGGLICLLSTYSRLDVVARARAASVLSRVALWAVVVLVASGVSRSLAELGGLDGFSTRYGAFIIVKLVLLASLVALGAVNRYRHVGRVREGGDDLLKVVRVEAAIMVFVLAVTSVLAATTPPVAAAGSEPTSVTATGSDFATTLRARLTATPGTSGPNRFEVELRGYDDDAPIDGVEVTATFTFRGGGDEVAPTNLALSRTGAGVYAASGPNLALPGPWEIDLEVKEGTSVRQIGLVLATRPSRAPRKTVTAGQPTIYDVDLGEQGRVQFYVDPSKSGSNEVHATFFDAAGGEPTDYTDFVLTALSPQGSVARLPIRMLTSAHLVAPAVLAPGTWRFDAFARGPSGERISGSFEEEIR